MENNDNEVSLTDSAIMDDSGVHSTPISTKESNKSDNDMMSYLCSMVCSIKEDSKKQNTMLCTKFDEQNVKFNELKGDMNNCFVVNDIKFNDIRDEMKQQSIKCESNFNELNEKSSNLNSIKSMDVKFNEMNTSIMKQFNKRCDELIASQKQSIEKMKV